jgi:hypothetical protein
LAVLVSLVPTAGTMFVWAGGTHPLSNLLGLRSGAQYLAGHVSPVVRSEAVLIKAVNPLLAAGDTVLMIYESRGLYLRAPSIEDTRLINWPALASTLGPERCLEGSGISHVLARPGAASYYERRGVAADVIGRGAFELFAQRCLTQLWTDGDAILFSTRRAHTP